MPRYLVWDNYNSDHNDAHVRFGDSPEEVAESYAEDIWNDLNCPDKLHISAIESEDDEILELQAREAIKFTVYANTTSDFSVCEDDSEED